MLKKKIFLFIYFFRKILRKAVMFFLEQYTCVLCETEESDYALCRKCEKKLLNKLDHLSPISLKGTVIENIDEVYAFFPYKNAYKELILMWKFENERMLSPFFASLFDKAFKKYLDKNDSYKIVPIPPRKWKIWLEGWDQMDEEANFLEFLFNSPVYKALARSSKKQKKTQNRKERLENMQNAYSVKKGFNLEGANICIIDDVLTTGSTLESAARVLKAAGAKKITAIVLCRS